MPRWNQTKRARVLPQLVEKIRYRLRQYWQNLCVALATKHVSGPETVTLADYEVALICLLKDGAYYLPHMLDHHRAIGVRHFVFIDNGSADATRATLAAEPDVTVYENTLPVKEYECLQRAKTARRAVSGGWFLFVDTDELAEMSRGEGRPISKFAAYCNAHGYNAVIGQVLDMFSDVSLKESADWDYARSTAAFDLYSLNHIKRFDYGDEDEAAGGFAWYMRNNRVSNPAIKFMFGGMRNEVFGENCCLTTHRMVRNLPHIELYSHAHCSGNVHCADFPFLIRHYKFAGAFLARDRAQLQRANWDHGEGARRQEVLGDADDFMIRTKEAHRYAGTDALISQGFLACSDRFLEAFPAISGAKGQTT